MKNTVKLTLLASAALAASTALAADVSLYGSVSTGLVVQHAKGLDNAESTTQTQMQSAWFGDSIFGIKAQEDLGNGWSVSVVLENEFGSDDGTLAGGDDGKLFDSQAYLSITNGAFTMGAGRLGGLASAGGDFDMIGAYDPLQTAFGVGGMGAFASRDYSSDNTLVAVWAPTESLQFSAMGSMGENDSTSAWNSRTHYYALGASYSAGALAGSVVIERFAYQKGDTVADDAMLYSAGLSYDLQVIKPMVMVQHASNVRQFQGTGLDNPYDLDSLLIGATAPLGNGTVLASAQYMKVKNTESQQKGDATIVGVAYTYDLSKRTQVYTGLTYAVGGKGLDRQEGAQAAQLGSLSALRGDMNGYQVGLGLAHTF